MSESELLKIFFLIQNVYPQFDYDEKKFAILIDLLQNTPFELAQRNLRTHVMSSPYPPTISDLSRRPEHAATGRYVPNAEETRRMLAEQERKWKALKPAEERVKQIAVR